MRVKLFLTLLASASLPALAQQAATVTGVITDADTGAPIPGAVVSIPSQGISVTTGPAGDYRISNSRPGEVMLQVTAPGYLDGAVQTLVYDGSNQGVDCVMILDDNTSAYLAEGANDLFFDESFLDDDAEGSGGQSISALTGTSDDIFYKFTRFGYQPLYSNYRGLNSSAAETYINGMPMNDLIRGGFSFSQLGGMTSRAFRNNTATTGLGAASYGFSGLGGSQNFNTITENYSPGFNGLVSYTNSNYYARAMATYSTGLNKNGLALTVSAIGRYSDEGIVDGTYYNSGGYFISLEKVFNPHHSLTLTTWGAPTEQANSRATVQEAFDLTGDNLYNPSWGWQSGKKRSDNIRRRFDPTVMLNWLYKDEKTTLNTGVAFRWLNFARTRLTYNQGNDPKPDYYQSLPSYWEFNREVPGMAEYYTDLWEHDSSVRQINWDEFYRVNALNNALNEGKPEEERKGSTYMQQWEHSNQFNFIVNSLLNRRLTDNMTLQAGVTFNYTKYHDYMTVKDLLGGEYWLDINTFADRDINNPLASADIMQNDLDNPNRRVGKGDVFGHDYDITAMKVQGFVQNQINTSHWDVNYGLQISYEQFSRFGHMRNGRAPQNSKGRSAIQRFDDAAVKAGATYKLNGRNYFTLRAQYGTEAPLIKDVYISPRISDELVDGTKSSRTFAADFSYNWNYRRFRGSIGVFYVNTTGAMERRGFYDEELRSFVNYAVTGVHRQNKGVELGMSYKILPSLTATFAGTYARYQYKNNPTGTRMSENSLFDPIQTTVYLKDHISVSTPQTAFNIGLDWAAPHSWYVGVNASYLADYYVALAYPYHETLPNVWQKANTVEEAEQIVKDFSTQPKLANNWVLNASLGKSFRFAYKYYLNLNLSVSNVLNNKNLVTNAYQQLRVDTRNYNADAFPYRLQYAQGIKVYFNVGFRF